MEGRALGFGELFSSFYSQLFLSFGVLCWDNFCVALFFSCIFLYYYWETESSVFNYKVQSSIMFYIVSRVVLLSVINVSCANNLIFTSLSNLFGWGRISAGKDCPVKLIQKLLSVDMPKEKKNSDVLDS